MLDDEELDDLDGELERDGEDAGRDGWALAAGRDGVGDAVCVGVDFCWFQPGRELPVGWRGPLGVVAGRDVTAGRPCEPGFTGRPVPTVAGRPEETGPRGGPEAGRAPPEYAGRGPPALRGRATGRAPPER